MTATTTAVTADQIIAEVRRLAAERPDYVYKREAGKDYCLYKHTDGTPGCIFGQALLNLGVPVDENDRGTIAVILGGYGIRATDKQVDWMGNVQWRQDNGERWAYAVERADREFPLV